MASEDPDEGAGEGEAGAQVMAAKKYRIQHDALARRLECRVGDSVAIPKRFEHKIEGWVRIGTIVPAVTRKRAKKAETAEAPVETEDAEA